MDITKFIESEYMNVETVLKSENKNAIIINSG